MACAEKIIGDRSGCRLANPRSNLDRVAVRQHCDPSRCQWPVDWRLSDLLKGIFRLAGRYMRKHLGSFACLVAVFAGNVSAESAEPTVFEKLEAQGARIGSIRIVRRQIFDNSKPKESGWLYRVANRTNALTREGVIASQLLFAEGDPISAQAIEETERVLRSNKYLYAVDISASPQGDGIVDLTITTRDNWTLFPQIGFTQKGGQTEFLLGVQESNLAGTGAELTLSIEDDGDRESSTIRYGNRNFLGTWWRFEAGFRDSDDGDGQRLRLFQPFYSLDSRWSGGLDITTVEQEEPLFSFGDEVAEYRRDQTDAQAWYGWSSGLVDGWSRRWMVGVAFNDDTFEPVFEPNRLVVVPEDRELRYPFVRFEAIQDRFVTATNFTRIAITEDVFVGTFYSATLGWFGQSTGSDRDGAIFDLRAASSAGDPTKALASWRVGAAGRVEGGDLRNGRFEFSGSYVRKQTERASWYAAIESTVAHEPDLDNPVLLGGLTGLRGYERGYGNGDARVVATLEQRLITDWYPWRLFRVGGAAFVDAGYVWGDDITGNTVDRVLTNVGVGIRLMSTRAASNRMVHIDFAVPLNTDDTVDDDFQISIQGKRGF